MIKKFISYYKPHKKIFLLDMSASFLISVIGIIYPIITRNMLNDYIPNKNVRLIVIFGISLFFIYFIIISYFVVLAENGKVKAEN